MACPKCHGKVKTRKINEVLSISECQSMGCNWYRYNRKGSPKIGRRPIKGQPALPGFTENPRT